VSETIDVVEEVGIATWLSQLCDDLAADMGSSTLL
jgi:hypothetical protein